jgi:hypothetical protein
MGCTVLAIVAAASFLSMLIALVVGMRLAAKLAALERRLEDIHDVPEWVNSGQSKDGGRVTGA